MVVSFLWLFSLSKNWLVVFLNVAFRLERWSNFWCDGNGLFFEAMRYWCFLDKRYYRYWCDYLNSTIVDDVFSIFGFSCFWMVFMVLCFFSGFFHSWIYHRQLCDSFANLSGPIFLPFFWGILTIVCNYMRWSPHIGQAMRCIVQVYTHLCRWSICWSSVPLLRLLAHTHRHDLCIHHALCVDHI